MWRLTCRLGNVIIVPLLIPLHVNVLSSFYTFLFVSWGVLLRALLHELTYPYTSKSKLDS